MPSKLYTLVRLTVCLFLFFTTSNLLFSQGVNLNRLSRPIALKGTIVTPTEVIQAGWVLIQGQKITGVYPQNTRLKFPDSTIFVDTKGIIFPGLVDLHNHVSYNVFPKWQPPKLYDNRYQWRFYEPEHKQKVKTPNENLHVYYCRFHIYGEIRAVTGGTTSLVTGDNNCVKILTRDLGDSDQVGRKNIGYLVDIKEHNPNPEFPDKVENEIAVIKSQLDAGSLDAFFIHLAEGKSTDPVTKQEFSLLKQKGLLTARTSIVHGIALGAADFDEMYQKGASLIWSPRSNLALYGQTANIALARNKKIRIAIAPDWSITGSNDMLGELGFAALWNKQQLGNLFTNKELVDMVTRIPAAMAGLSDKIGSIKAGLYADLLVISGNSIDPYSALINSNQMDIKLVMVNGSAIYGRQDLMENFWNSDKFEVILNTSPAMVLKLPSNQNYSYKNLKETLSTALETQQVKLAPVFPIRMPNNNQVINLNQ